MSEFRPRYLRYRVIRYHWLIKNSCENHQDQELYYDSYPHFEPKISNPPLSDDPVD